MESDSRTSAPPISLSPLGTEVSYHDRREFIKRAALTLGVVSAGGLEIACYKGKTRVSGPPVAAAPAPAAIPDVESTLPKAARVAADPTAIPPPITRRAPAEVGVELEVREVVADIGNGIQFEYMTYNGQVPAPLIRVREGDTVALTLRNPSCNHNLHNVDFHAALGPGGGAVATTVAPGQLAHLKFRVLNSGLFVYHCAVPNFDQHISAGMFGLILVEPAEGLPTVDHELYLGQNEMYVTDPFGSPGLHGLDWNAMLNEQPAFVTINGEVNALTSARRGAIQVKTGETARVYFGVGGPNLTGHLHPIGGILEEVWMQGSLRNPPLRDLQTVPVPPGSAMIGTLRFPVPGEIKLIDHSVTRSIRKGCMAVIDISGPANPELFNPGGVEPLT